MKRPPVIQYMVSTYVLFLHLYCLMCFSIVLYSIYPSLSRFSQHELFRNDPDHSNCRSLHAEALQATVSEGLAQGPYVTATAGFEPTNLRSKGIDSTNAPPCPTQCIDVAVSACLSHPMSLPICLLIMM